MKVVEGKFEEFFSTKIHLMETKCDVNCESIQDELSNLEIGETDKEIEEIKEEEIKEELIEKVSNIQITVTPTFDKQGYLIIDGSQGNFFLKFRNFSFFNLKLSRSRLLTE